ncbi:hypothetical protein GA0070624_3356 [Micromonospora rhizosphaerae]|uniref:Uncharacterized protein n=1 Tax=Micromonospora rhizosphaerae TaxID=568872 RepID=A0A1C6SB20_9ACTN|nr:hypothetical protein [Micromonospora rhizosphaerae]SCL26697.1 hypothetical protein GA0070624_3356 [Micromonospora rhizosphaerae]
MFDQSPVRGPLTTRRRLLKVAGASAAALATGGLLLPGRAAASEPAEWTTRAKFDALDLGFNNGDGRKTDLNEDRAALGWGESYVLQAYLLMYEAYRDPYYLDKAIDHIDHVLASRDTVRGVTDWRGQSLPAWRAGWPYSAGHLDLVDTAGRPTLRLVSALAYAESMTVTVSAGTLPGTFRIDTSHKVYKNAVNTFDNLTMDPTSPDYAVRRINDAFDATKDQLTAHDLRAQSDAAGDPVPGAQLMSSSYFYSCVHTGQIAYPIAWFARIVHTTPKLHKNRLYRDKAREYYAAAEAAVAVHDEEYLVTDDGRGYYGYLKGAPVNLDGSDLPHNYSCSMARVYLELDMAGHGHRHRRRAEELVRSFVADLRHQPDGTATWTYYRGGGLCYTGWTRADDVSMNFPVRGATTKPEDTEHGHIEATMATVAYRAGIGITAADMTALARTLNQRILQRTPDGRLTATEFVDGSGRTGIPYYETIVPPYLGLASFGDTDTLIRAGAQLMAQNDPAPQVVPIYSTAYLNWASRTGARVR